jgi:hypothetical protein
VVRRWRPNTEYRIQNLEFCIRRLDGGKGAALRAGRAVPQDVPHLGGLQQRQAAGGLEGRVDWVDAAGAVGADGSSTPHWAGWVGGGGPAV